MALAFQENSQLFRISKTPNTRADLENAQLGTYSSEIDQVFKSDLLVEDNGNDGKLKHPTS